jgi:hypothetical protein
MDRGYLRQKYNDSFRDVKSENENDAVEGAGKGTLKS